MNRDKRGAYGSAGPTAAAYVAQFMFLPSRSCGPAGWLALLLIKAGDVETNPGPTTTQKQVWICDICHQQIHGRKPISIRCNRLEHWVHILSTSAALDTIYEPRVPPTYSLMVSLWRFAGGSHRWTTGDLFAGSLSDHRWQPPEYFLFC